MSSIYYAFLSPSPVNCRVNIRPLNWEGRDSQTLRCRCPDSASTAHVRRRPVQSKPGMASAAAAAAAAAAGLATGKAQHARSYDLASFKPGQKGPPQRGQLKLCRTLS